jgi:hypothetical protein
MNPSCQFKYVHFWTLNFYTTNEELITKYKSQDIITVIKIRRLEWLGHVIRMDETGSVKKIFEGKLEGRRGRGRPRLRWINDVEGDLRKTGVKRWRAKVLDRVEWASIVREGKAKLKGPQCYRKKKLLHNAWVADLCCTPQKILFV